MWQQKNEKFDVVAKKMLETLLAIVSFWKSAVYYTILLSWRTGYFIITTGKVLATGFFTGLEYAFATVKVFLEDFHPFADDVLNHLQLIFRGLHFVTGKVYSIVEAIYPVINSAIEGVKMGIRQLYHDITTTIDTGVEILTFVKWIIILFGSGVRFLLTLISHSLLWCFIYGTYCLGLLLAEVENIIAKAAITMFRIYEFLTDVPTESYIGLIAAVCFIYIFMIFDFEVYRFLKHKFRITKELIRRNLLTFKQSFHRNIIRRVSPDNTEDANTNTEKYCVVCQEHAKNVLLLPCKHLCLCRHCELMIRRYDDTDRCPVCRTHVEETMMVFI